MATTGDDVLQRLRMPLCSSLARELSMGIMLVIVSDLDPWQQL